MWCLNCQQDVPAIASDDAARCAKCGRFLKRPSDESSSEDASVSAQSNDDSKATISMLRIATPDVESQASEEESATTGTALPEDDWMLDQQVRLLQRRYHLPESTGQEANQQPDDFSLFRKPLRESDWQTTDWNSNSTKSTLADRSGNFKNARTMRRPSIIAWILMALGLMAFVCGGVLLGCSFLGHRNDLWNLGMPLTLGGQFGLLLGLVLQLDNLWQANRRTTEALEDVDRQLHQMQNSATQLRMSHGSPGQAFYAHFAEGAHPHLLLSDLKGQLDLLANRLSQQP